VSVRLSGAHRHPAGAAKQSIISFVKKVTKPGSPNLSRLLSGLRFDNDGTLWSEQPIGGPYYGRRADDQLLDRKCFEPRYPMLEFHQLVRPLAMVQGQMNRTREPERRKK